MTTPSDQYHVRYAVTVGDATRVVVQDDYRVDEAVIRVLRQLRRESVVVTCDSHRPLVITVRQVR